MTPASAVDSPQPARNASSHKTDDHEKKDDKKSIPDKDKRPLGAKAADASKPSGGDQWSTADDKGTGKALDGMSQGKNAPVPPVDDEPVDELAPKKKTPTSAPISTGNVGDTLQKPYTTTYIPTPHPGGISGSQLDNHLQNAKKEAAALKTLTTGGNFEKVAGDDGELTLQEAQQYLETHPIVANTYAPSSSLAEEKQLNEALKTITSNGDFERLAGGYNKPLTLPQMQQSLVDQQQQVAHLQTVQQNFKQWAGADGRLSRDEVKQAAAQATDPATQNALGWLDQNYDGTAAKSYYSDPNQTGAPFDGSVSPDINQKSMPNCVRLATIDAFAQTPAGKAMLENLIDKQADGSFNVTFPGDPNKKTYQVKPEELNGTWSTGDTGGQVIATALEKFGADNPDTSLYSASNVMNLLSGRGQAPEYTFNGKPPELAKDYLIRNASAINSGQQVMTIGGKAEPNGDGNFAVGANHAYAVKKIDVEKNVVTYANPWDPQVEHTIALDKFVNDVSQPGSGCVFTSMALY